MASYNACGPPVNYYVPVVPGCQGPTGLKGSTGPTGPEGPTGPADKTFIIDHPTDTDRYLVHACIEGPESAVYYRGQSEIKDGEDSNQISLPHYVSKLASDFTVQITPIFTGRRRPQINYEVTEVSDGVFTVYGEPGKFFWHVYGKRADIVVEPYKKDVIIKGQKPYTWM